MKRLVSVILAVLLVLGCSFALAADEWYCPNCGAGPNDSNFCPKCGTARPAADATPAPTTSSVLSKFGKTVEVGSHVFFGNYEQDGDLVYGNEPIEWIVLDVADDTALLISRYALAKKTFNDTSNGATWATSSLRAWLNRSFYNTAFSAAEQSNIVDTKLDESRSQCHPDYAPKRIGDDTTDKVFLLSYAQAEKYMPSKYDRLCVSTAETLNNGANKSDDRYLDGEQKTSWYWLRSPAFKNNIICVGWDGEFASCYMSHTYGVVRPCITVKLSAIQ